MSTLNVDKVDPSTGTALEIGSSGDTITVPSGATLDISASTLTPPATMPASSAANLTNIPGANITGTIAAVSGANLTSLTATNLGSGTVPTARLGSGTASSSTVLYGDQTYKAEPGGNNTPSFRAISVGVSNNLTNATATKIAFNKVDGSDAENPSYNTGGTMDTSNYHWTPGTLGKYWFCASMFIYGTSIDVPIFTISIRKDDSDVVLESTFCFTNTNYGNVVTVGQINVDDVTDHFSVWGYQNTGITQLMSGTGTKTYFTASKMIGA